MALKFTRGEILDKETGRKYEQLHVRTDRATTEEVYHAMQPAIKAALGEENADVGVGFANDTKKNDDGSQEHDPYVTVTATQPAKDDFVETSGLKPKAISRRLDDLQKLLESKSTHIESDISTYADSQRRWANKAAASKTGGIRGMLGLG